MIRFARVGVPYVAADARIGVGRWCPYRWRGIEEVPLLGLACIGSVQTVPRVALRVWRPRWLSRLASLVSAGRAVIERYVCGVSRPCYSCLWVVVWC